MILRLLALMVALMGFVGPAQAQNGPLQLTLSEMSIEPLPIAIPLFQAENAGSEQYAADISRLVAQDLIGSALFREIPPSAFISQITSFGQQVAYADWRAINAQKLVVGAVSISGNQLVVKFRLFDVFTGEEQGDGLQFAGTTEGWRRMAHKVADTVYSRVTGAGGYFDSRVVYVAETGPKDNRRSRIAIMDFDGANVKYLTDGPWIVFAPRFSPSGDRVLYTSYETGFPRITMMDVAIVDHQEITTAPGEMSFSPRFSRDGRQVIYSLADGGNTDLYRTDLTTGQHQRLTNAPSIETAPSLSPDGSQIVFESDRSGAQQIYIMGENGGEPRRISFGEGRYGSPVWSPRGDLIAFTKQNAGRFHIGVMRTDGSEERLLTASFLDEGPSWSPNGNVIMFTRETQGADGAPGLYSVDIMGRNLKRVGVSGAASDPSWGPLQR